MSKYKEIYAPVNGVSKDITDVNDPVFAQKMVGDGIALIPTDGLIKAPCDGLLNHVFGTNHAFTMLIDDDTEVLIHLGIDTVELEGNGFERIYTDLETPVKAGELLIKMDLDYIKSQDKEIDVLVIISDSDDSFKFKKKIKKNLNSGDLLFKFKH